MQTTSTQLSDHSIDISNTFTSEPEKLDFVLPGFLAGAVGILASPGGTGKTWVALELCCAIASPLANDTFFRIPIEAHGRAVFLSAEDPPSALRSRLHSLGRYMSPEAREEVSGSLQIVSLVGLPTDLHPKVNADGLPIGEDWTATIAEQCHGARLIVLDTLSRWHSRDENSNGEMAMVIKRVEYLAKTTGASVMFLHHSNKSMALQGRGDEQQSVRGASSIVDNARWSSAVCGMTEPEAQSFGLGGNDGERENYLRLVVTKQSHGKPFSQIWLKRSEGGVLLRVDLEKKHRPASKAASTNNREAMRRGQL